MTETMTQEAKDIIDLAFNEKFALSKKGLYDWVEQKVDNIIPVVKEFKTKKEEKKFISSFLPFVINFMQNNRLTNEYLHRYELLTYLKSLGQKFSFFDVQLLLRNNFVLLGTRNIVPAYRDVIRYIVEKDFESDWDEFFLRLPDILPYDIEFDYVDAIVDFYCKKNDLIYMKFTVSITKCFLVQEEGD